MSYIGTTDYNLEVLRGNVGGHAMVSIFGHDEALNNTKTTVAPTVSTTNIDQSAIAATPAVVGVASTDNTNDNIGGTGALTVRVFGLDSSGNAQTNDITMTGTTAVNTGSTFSAVNGLRVLTTGSNNSNTGTLWVGTGTFTAGVPAVEIFSMNIGFNKGLTAYYAVPTGKTLYLRQLTLTLATGNKDADFFIEQSTDGLMWITDAVFGLAEGTFHEPLLAVPGIVAGSHIRIEAQSTSAGAIDATAILSCELIND